jgi:type II secretory pathway component PulJ
MGIMYKNLLKTLKAKSNHASSEAGFSLADLMIGAALTVLVTAGGGTAIAAMIDNSTTSNARSERRVEMNRALDFIVTEVNRSSSITQTPTLPSNFSDRLTSVATQIDTSTAQVVLELEVQQGGDKVIYFTAAPRNGAWKGPRVLYRLGPSFTATGTYIDPGDSADWEPLPLLDRLNSFTASVNGESVELNPVGRIQKLMGRTENYAVSMDTGTKKSYVAPSTFSASTGANATTTPLFTTPQGDVIVKQNSTMKVEFLGGEIKCGPTGPVIPTQAKVQLQGGTVSNGGWITPTGTLTYNNVQPDTSLNITGWAKSPSCGNHNMKYDTKSNQKSQVLTLVDGDFVPEFAPMPGQRTIDAFMQSYIDTSTGKIKLAKNEVIFLFELGTTNSKSQAYDMQDMVVKATITPTVTSSSSSSSPTTVASSSPSSTNNAGCNNGVGNGSEGCTPGKARPNDEVVRDAAGNIICTPSPGSPCTQASRNNP